MSVLLGMAALVLVSLAGAVGYDWKNRRHGTPSHDVDSSTRNTRNQAEGKGLPHG